MKKSIIKTIIFCVIGVGMFFLVQSVLGVSNYFSEHTEMMFEGYYEQPENTVDAVLIGNSHVYKFWQGAFAWQEHGIAALALSTSDMPCSIVKNIAIEACKTQKPKVMVFDSTQFAQAEADENNKIYLVLRSMRFSRNYVDMIESYCDYAGITGTEKLKYYFPILQFHSRWKEINAGDFVQSYASYLNSCYLKDFLSQTIENMSHIATDRRAAISEKSEQELRELLEWCGEQDFEAVFIASPVLLGEERLAMVNTVGDIVSEYGINFVNYNDPGMFESFDFDVAVDFQDKSHTNVNGSWKFTKVFGKYLIDEYGLEDHRGEEAYEQWDKQTQKYYELIKDYFIY
ncbi:MAG: hypothetical protein Q4C61_03965 [Lachnospiraceae bacterium]|nr:hypothetical protein [Lachnospiraceae bacterium]